VIGLKQTFVSVARRNFIEPTYLRVVLVFLDCIGLCSLTTGTILA
jgi:hypothetical protein